MPMPLSDNRKLKDFTRKIRNEGSAGFAGGPWDARENTGKQSQSATERRSESWSMHSVQPPKQRKKTVRTTLDLVLTWIAIAALVLIVVGVLGTWLSYRQDREIRPDHDLSTTRVERVVQPANLGPIEERLSALENRLSRILAPFTEQLKTIENRLVNNRSQFGERTQNIERRLVNTRTQFDERAQTIELRLANTRTQFEERTQTLEQRLVHTHDPYDIRLQNIEERLANTTDRLDKLSLVLTTLASKIDKLKTAAVARVHEVQPIEPKAIIENPTQIRAPQIITARTEQESVPLQDEAVAIIEESAVPLQPSQAPQVVASKATQESRPLQDEEVFPAEHARQAVVEEDTAPAQEAVTKQQTRAPQEVVLQEQTKEAQPQARVEPPAPATPAKISTPTAHKTGNWVINLASYTSKRTANKMIAEFQHKGVAAELVTATVKGKTIYRARVFGFENRKAATARAAVIREQLGLGELWITKR